MIDPIQGELPLVTLNIFYTPYAVLLNITTAGPIISNNTAIQPKLKGTNAICTGFTC